MVNTRTLVPRKLVRLAVVLTGVLLCPPADKMHTYAVRAAEATSPGASAPSIRDAKLAATTVVCFGCLEVSCVVDGTFDNPFDPREIQVDGRFRGPTGNEVVVPGFLYQDCRRHLTDGGEEIVQKAGEPFWKIRFAPTVPGRWQGVVRARDRSGTAESKPLHFEARPGSSRGFIRRARGSDYFSYEDGTPFFPVGENIAWAGRRGTYDFDKWLPAAGKAGINLARIWLQWNQVLSIEHQGTGAGRYDLANAWRMDYVLDLARQNGVRVFFTCDSPEPYQKEHYWLGKLTAKPWERCPHNTANGGPLKEPRELYTTEEGHRLIRQRLRYIVARWGWDPNIFCWELWNELNVFPGWDKLVPEIARWHAEMACVLRSLDPNRHLISTSFCTSEGHADIWKLPELDFIQSHTYGVTDMAEKLPEVTRTMKQRYGRPHLFGEFGVPLTAEVLAGMAQVDPQGVHLHNALWSSALSGGAGTAICWWWDNYVHPNDLYHVFTPLARFCEGVPWTTAGFRPVAADVSWTKPSAPRPPRDWVLPCQGQPQLGGAVDLDFARPPSSLGRLYLYGKAQHDQQKPVTLQVNRPSAGSVRLRIGRVWVLGVLEVKVDGKPVLRQEFPAGPGAGPWKKSELDKRWNIYGADYDQDVVVDVPAGKHAVELFNAGTDGITIDRITLPNMPDDQPPVRCLGLKGDGCMLLWVQNAGHTFAALLEKRSAEPVENARATVRGIPPGTYQVDWWDTTSGRVTHTTTVQATESGLPLDLPTLTTDVACKVQWARR